VTQIELCCCYLCLPDTAIRFWSWLLSCSLKQSCYTGNFTHVVLNCCSLDSGKVSWRSELAVAMYNMSPLNHPRLNSTCISTAIGLDTIAPTLLRISLCALLKVKVWLLLPSWKCDYFCTYMQLRPMQVSQFFAYFSGQFSVNAKHFYSMSLNFGGSM